MLIKFYCARVLFSCSVDGTKVALSTAIPQDNEVFFLPPKKQETMKVLAFNKLYFNKLKHKHLSKNLPDQLEQRFKKLRLKR